LENKIDFFFGFQNLTRGGEPFFFVKKQNLSSP
jgi:hypothetical protein